MNHMNFRIAIPYSQDEVFQHFGKSSQFKIYTVANGAVAAAEVLDTAGVGHEDLALWLVQHSVEAVVCGGIGPGAQARRGRARADGRGDLPGAWRRLLPALFKERLLWLSLRSLRRARGPQHILLLGAHATS